MYEAMSIPQVIDGDLLKVSQDSGDRIERFERASAASGA